MPNQDVSRVTKIGLLCSIASKAADRSRRQWHEILREPTCMSSIRWSCTLYVKQNSSSGVRQRVTYKLAVLTHKARTAATPTYLSELVQTRAPPRALSSSDAPTLVVPRIHTELARRASSVAAPSTWISLPADIRLCKNILTLKRHLETHLFKLT